MASLNFKGKSAVWNHHLSVPYHTLEKDKENSLKGENENENLLIEGDNLLALKALLPNYQGKVKCIYIDPPYNTGEEDWVYDDNVNNPIIKSWIGEIVGKEGDDLVRHDKWLCMMAPRLKLLKELMSEEGVIFISIDDNEVHHLRCLMDEIFGAENFSTEFVWEKKKKPSFLHKNVGKISEYILCYVKNSKVTYPFSVDVTTAGKKYPLNNAGNSISTLTFPPDSVQFGFENEKIRPQDMSEGNIKTKLLNELIVENSRNKNEFTLEGEWRYSQETLNEILDNEEIIYISKIPFRPNHIKAGGEIKKMKNMLSKFHYDIPTNEDATSEIESIFGKKVFDTPKPVKLIETLIKSVTYDSPDAIVLDSYSGSGTTAHAVLQLNKDGGNRKFILVQLPETLKEKAHAKEYGYNYVHEITRDRIKKVITRDELSVGFTYYKLGPSIDGKKMLAGKDLPTWDVFAKYVHYLATGKPIDEVKKPKDTWEIVTGTKGTGIYLIYKDKIEDLKNLAITRDWLESVKGKEGKKIVYAPACFLDKEVLDEHEISFVQIPFNLFSRS